MIPGNCELDLKALAAATGDKKIDLVPLRDVLPLTGYVRGGVTALGCRKDYPVCADETIDMWDVISISAGQRGTQILITPANYLRSTSAKLAPIARQKTH